MSSLSTRAVPPAGSERYHETLDAYDPTTSRLSLRDPASWVGLAVIVAAVVATAAFGAMFEPGAWYQSLVRPELTPPAITFPIVWTTLYALMALAAWLVWLCHMTRLVWGALALFALQLVLNAAWSWLFFGQHEIALALADLTALWFAVLATTVAFWRHHRVASMLLWPYMVWLTFAGWLNYQLWVLN